jgi:deoxyribonuclease V
MDLIELKKEQLKLAPKIIIKDSFHKIKTIGGTACIQINNQILASVVVCEYPSMTILEKQTYLLNNPLPYTPGFIAYREMPAIIEAYNQLEIEPGVLLVKGSGIIHSRGLGVASHTGLALNKATIGVTDKLMMGKVQSGNVMINGNISGFEIKTREHAKPIYVSPGHLISLGSVLNIIPKTIIYPHKMPEPIHLAIKVARKAGTNLKD